MMRVRIARLNAPIRALAVGTALVLLSGCGSAAKPATLPPSPLSSLPPGTQPGGSTQGTQVPGPSAALFNAPYYRCVRNVYVAPNGNDANSGSSATQPWQTLQHADASGRTAGDCVNMAPGTYTTGVTIRNGGNSASSTGYVVYRCMVMDACTVAGFAANQNGTFAWDFTQQPMTGNYVIIDGLVLSAPAETQYGQAIEAWDGNETGPGAKRAVHHIWLLNSVVTGYGQTGIQMNDGEYYYVVHDRIYGNANVGCDTQGSGLSFFELKAFPNLARTADDSSNSILGAIGSFNNAVEWNVLYNNSESGCGTPANPYNTDGNNIIMDTLNNSGGTGVPYPGSVLIAFNVTYNAGGRGIHLFLSENVTVANNSCYNSALDPANNGSYRPCIGDNSGFNNTFFNNIAYAIPASPTPSAVCTVDYDTGAQGSCLELNNAYAGLGSGSPADTFANNIAYCATPPGGPGCEQMQGGVVFSCTTNLCGIDPGWVDVGTITTGTETTPPQGTNFALQSTSPAIGKGLTRSYLSSQSVDIGACYHTTNPCPASP
jgi:hypothetical protein